MKSFLRYITETVLLENKAWHQFVGQNAKKLLDRAGLTDAYERNKRITMDPAHGTPEHLTGWISEKLGMQDLNADEGRWVLKHLHGGGIQRAEDVQSTVIPNLQRLRQAKSEGKSDASLAKIQGAAALHAHLNKVYPASSESLEHLKPEEYTVHGENEHWTVVQPHTKEAACAVGKGTNWCTASTGHSMFDHYNAEAPIYTLIPKNPIRKGERYQMHVPKQGPDNIQFMDEKDEPIGFQGWSPLSKPDETWPRGLEAKQLDRPLPEIADPHARATIHGMRDLHEFKNTSSMGKQIDMMTTRLAKGSKSGTPDDVINAAMIQHARAYDPVGENDTPTFGKSHIRLALTRGGSATADQAKRHLDQLSRIAQRDILDDATMEHLQTHEDPKIRLIGAMKKWKPEHVMRAAKDPAPEVAQHALPHFDVALEKQLKPAHVDQMLKHPDFHVRASVISWGLGRGRLTHDQVDKLAADPDERMRHKLAEPHNVKELSPAHIHTMLQHSRPLTRFASSHKAEQLAAQPKTPEVMGQITDRAYESLIRHLHPLTRDRWSSGNPISSGETFNRKITATHITRALQNPDKYDPHIRQMLLTHDAFDPAKHMELARQNKDLNLQKTEHFVHGDPS